MIENAIENAIVCWMYIAHTIAIAMIVWFVWYVSLFR